MEYTLTAAEKLDIAKSTLTSYESEHFRLSLASDTSGISRMETLERLVNEIRPVVEKLQKEVDKGRTDPQTPASELPEPTVTDPKPIESEKPKAKPRASRRKKSEDGNS